MIDSETFYRIPDPLSSLAERILGVRYLFPIQRFVISNVLEGHSQIVVLPTGSGKSLCFQAPAFALPGPTLVLVPLLSLLQDQERRMREALERDGADPAVRPDAVAVLRGGLSPQEKSALFGGMKSGRVRIVLATPEACLVPAAMRELADCRVSHLVVDEAHCIGEWGDTFRPAYLELGRLAREIRAPLITAFTATASDAVIARIKEVLFPDAEARVLVGDPDRPNIDYTVLPALSKTHGILELARTLPRPILVFCRSRGGTELLARTLRLRRPGEEAFFYHAGLSKPERRRVEEWFFRSAGGILFSTSAYGMGVDKANIRSVIHRDVPPSIESYLQETGRAGRDGKPSRAVLLVSREDESFAKTLSDAAQAARYAALLGYALCADGCRRARLAGLIGRVAERPSCSGCDVCRGEAVRGACGEAEILSFVRRHERRFVPAQVRDMLAGRRGWDVRRDFLDAVPGFGGLAGWDPDDVEEALGTLRARGALSVPARGPWKGRLASGAAPSLAAS